MANPEHLKILKQGVKVWNRWRDENPEILPDLKYEDLSGEDLSGAHLEYADLEGAGLEFARLHDAHLNGANLIITGLLNTGLGGTNFVDASLGYVSIGDVDLSQTEGLERVRHIGPSYISVSTLERTAAGLAHDATRQEAIETFYRGAGVEEDLIQFFRARIGQPIEFYSCFISYSHTDKSFARRLYADLQAHGIRCFHDEHDLNPGDRLLDALKNAIDQHDKILLCCSEASLNSWWVKDEIRKAQERERKEKRLIIIPLNLDGYLFDWDDGLASDLTSRLAADFTGWEDDNGKFTEQFERVVKALRTDESVREKPAEPKS